MQKEIPVELQQENHKETKKKIQFTEEQRKVIWTRDKNILVSAAAGSGKTAVLVERILTLITDPDRPCDIDRLLIVTFTSAAASEMRERIHAGILKLLDASPEDKNLQKQSTLIHNAQITTIDSFCLFLLRNHFHEIDLDPGFRIGDPGEIKLLEKQVLKDTLEEFYRRKDEGFLRFADAYCPDGKDQKLEALIEELYHYSMSHPWPEKWLDACDSLTDELNEKNIFATQWMQYGMDQIREILNDGILMVEEALRICDRPDGPYMYSDMLQADKEFLEQLEGLLKDCSSSESFQRLSAACGDVKWKRLSAKADSTVSVQHKETVKQLRERYKGIVSDMSQKYFSGSLQQLVEKERVADFLKHWLIVVTKAFLHNLETVKKEKNIMDFSDMEHYALKILLRGDEPTETALRYREHFQEVMIDEYQDSNPVQELLLSSVSRQEKATGNRFMVGDMKQSIYKFRLAKPEIFMEKFHKYQEKDSDDCLICLKKNFRSRKEVLESTNAVFSVLMTLQVGGVSYDEESMLYQGADYPSAQDCDTELCLFETSRDSGLEKRKAEAYMIAHKIKQLVGNGLSGREVSYRDIVILFRSGAGMAEELRSVLLSEGIPAYVTAGTGYFSAGEVSLLMNLLRTINNPYEDIPFCSVATSLFFGFNEEELALIRAGSRRGIRLYESFREIAGKDAADTIDAYNDIKEKVTRVLELLDELRKEAIVKTIPELVNFILVKFHYTEYVSAMPAGQQRKANVEMFVQKAVDFEKTSLHGLFHFIRYMEQLQKYDVDYGEAATLAETADVVRIMTIHKSKGLEFPICIVAGLDKPYNLRDTTGPVLIDADWGIAADYIDSDRHLKGKTFRKLVLSQKMRRDSLGEELRILYVAMTRAKEKLILTGTIASPEKKMEEAAGLVGEDGRIPMSVLASANSNLQYIMLAYRAAGAHITLKYIREEDLQIRQEEQLAARLLREQKLEVLSRLELVADDPVMQKQRELWERFSYEYPHEALAGLYTKTSVSELKKATMEEEEIPVLFETDDVESEYMPAFMRREKTLHEGASRGSAMHRLLELLDFEKYVELAEKKENLNPVLEAELEQFINLGRISREYGELISLKKIEDFLRSPMAARMARALKKHRLFKEQPFILAVDAHMLGSEYPYGEKVLIQGIIDVYFEEDGEIVILDYKTDKVSNGEELLQRYRTQLDYYEEAVERLTGMRVKEKVLYSFACMEEIKWK